MAMKSDQSKANRSAKNIILLKEGLKDIGVKARLLLTIRHNRFRLELKTLIIGKYFDELSLIIFL